MQNAKKQAYELLKTWKGNRYLFGTGVFSQIGTMVSRYGRTALVVGGSHRWPLSENLTENLENAGLKIAGGRIVTGAKPNAPREDVYRLATYILHYKPDCIVAAGGGSTIDACKCADILAVLGGCVTPEIDHYLGTGIVTRELHAHSKKLIPLIAVQTASSSGAHLTKYANVTDPVSGQKKLIVDDAVVPVAALFDYGVTTSMPERVTIDGILDAISHTFEVYCSAKADTQELCKKLAVTAVSLCAAAGPKLQSKPDDAEAREAIGLATDLGGYAIMTGGTSGAHLTSFSLVDLTGHGTACGIMNPYYAVLFSKAIQVQLKVIGDVFAQFGYAADTISHLDGRALAVAVAKAMIAFSKRIQAPTTLGELNGFNEGYIQRALQAAKDPQLTMKLQNMPVPMAAEDVDIYMEPVLRAAATGNFELIKEM